MNNISAQSFMERRENINSLKEEFFDFHEKITTERLDNFFAWQSDQREEFVNRDWILKNQYADELVKFFDKLLEESPKDQELNSLDPDQRNSYFSRYFLLDCIVGNATSQIMECAEAQRETDKKITDAFDQDLRENDPVNEEGER